MKTIVQTELKFQFNSTLSPRGLLDPTKLSHLPKRKPFTFGFAPNPEAAVVAVCAECGRRLESKM